ncbi:inverse autotransporter beta domain-containing protein [Xenorhabdus taiwanensis]
MAGNILSSSPAELAEQAKSYAIGQFNNTISSGAQKWLSQFGTVRINFGLDKKGTLKNNSFDLLLPLYDNKADWLFFSQLGYRNKDSRDTMNVGLGGRYFSQNWMYGLNTFYDYDLTGKNQRLGLGGEIGGDYIKLSANTYYRLTNWKDSRNFVGYYERPANGYDINGEFFLPTYPHLGAKLTYEQYFGDNVTLFNRDTKQKNPNLAKLGLTYTPVPLFTLGMDYKQGGSGHSETQFLANFNYKLGVPLSVQLSPENVAVARTLAGSRYDLIERNNHIVLEHQKKPIAQLSLPETIVGYSQSQHEITVKLSSNAFVKQIHWATNQDFEQHGGKLSSHVGHIIKITLPTYLSGDNQNNNYPIYALAELEDGQKSAPVAMRVIVRPFMLKKQEEAYFTPAGPLPATGNKKDGYTFNPVITFDTVNGTPIKNATISHVQWITDPKIGSDTGLQWIDWEPSDSVALDENGYFKRKPVLISSRLHKDVKVYLQLDSQSPQLVGEVSFDENPASFHVDKVEVLPSVPSLIANGSQAYTYSAVVLDSDNNPVRNQKIANVNWSKDKDHDGLIWNPLNGEVKTDEEGKLTTSLASTKEIKDVTVSLAIGSHKPVPAGQPVSFIVDTPKYHISSNIVNIDQAGSLIANGQNFYTYMAIIIDSQGNKVKNQKIANVKWSIKQGKNDVSSNPNLTFTTSGDTTGNQGELIAYLRSKEAIQDVLVSLSTEGQDPVPAQRPVTFTADTSKYRIKMVSVEPPGTGSLVANDQDTYTYKAVIIDSEKNPVLKQKITGVKWRVTTKDGHDLSSNQDFMLTDDGDTTGNQGELIAYLKSKEAIQDVLVSLAIEGQDPVPAQRPVTFTADTSKYRIKMVSVEPPGTGSLVANDQDTYTYKAVIIDSEKNPVLKQKITGVKWRVTTKDGHDLSSNQDFMLTDDGDTTGNQGELIAYLKSKEAIQDVLVSLAIEGQDPVPAQRPVTFTADTSKYRIKIVSVEPPGTGSLVANDQDTYTYKAVIIDSEKNPVLKQKITGVKWRVTTKDGHDLSSNQDFTLTDDGDTTGNQGELIAYLKSKEAIQDVLVSLAIEGQDPVPAQRPVTFTADTSKYRIKIVSVEPPGTGSLVANDQDTYTYKAVIIDSEKNSVLKQKITGVKWRVTTKDGHDLSSNQDFTLTDDGDTTGNQGELIAYLKSKEAIQDVLVSLSIEGQDPVPAQRPVTFTADTSKYRIKIVSVEPPGTGSLVANDQDTYTYKAVIIDSEKNSVLKQKITGVKWRVTTKDGHDLSSNQDFTLTDDGDTTGNQGELIAYLKSKEAIQDVLVSLSIEGQDPVPAQRPVTFTADTQDYRISGDIQVSPSGTLTADGAQKYTYTAAIVGIDGKPVQGGEIIHNATWKIEHPANPNAYGLILDQSDMTIDGKGQLTATLTSTKAINGVVVSLTVGKQKPIQAKPAVDFKPKQVSIAVTPPSPILVGKNYTLTVNVKDATGNNSEPNKKVNWSLKTPNQKGVTLNPTISTTQGDGTASTTLTSTQAQTVTVEASVEGVETVKSVDVEFKWPTIQKPTVAEKTGTVPADGDKNPQHAYHYTAHVFGADGTTPYTEQDIKFKWRLKSEKGSTPKNTWLSEPGEVTVQPDGTLKVQLLSSQENPVVTGAIVCLVAVDEKSAEISETEQCAEAVDFKKPLEFFEITHLKVDGFNPNNPRLGDGNHSYTYTATIIQKNGNQIRTPSDGDKIDAKWDTNFKAGKMYNNKPEWEIKSNNTVRNGQITAVLTSSVGIGNIEKNQVSNGLIVTLSVPNGEKNSSKEADAVVFEPVTQTEAWLHVFSDKKPDGNLYKEQNRPYNVFDGLKAQLVDKLTGKPISQSNDEVEITGGQIGNLGNQDSNNKGVIRFSFPEGKTTLEMTVQKPNYARYRYNYHFDIKRYFLDNNTIDLIGTDSDADCAGGVSGNEIKNITNIDLVDGDNSLTKEFPDSFNWGILDYFDPTGTVSVIVPTYDGSTKSLFDLRTDRILQDDNGKGYLLCVIHSDI